MAGLYHSEAGSSLKFAPAFVDPVTRAIPFGLNEPTAWALLSLTMIVFRPVVDPTARQSAAVRVAQEAWAVDHRSASIASCPVPPNTAPAALILSLIPLSENVDPGGKAADAGREANVVFDPKTIRPLLVKVSRPEITRLEAAAPLVPWISPATSTPVAVLVKVSVPPRKSRVVAVPVALVAIRPELVRLSLTGENDEVPVVCQLVKLVLVIVTDWPADPFRRPRSVPLLAKVSAPPVFSTARSA